MTTVRVRPHRTATSHAPGEGATNPWRMPIAGWIAVAKRTWAETAADNVGLIAAGVAFYGFLAIMPLLGAVVLVYGIAADPATVARNMTQLTSVMPQDVAKLIGDQLMTVVTTSDGKKGFGLLLALTLALFGARNGAGAIITALNIAYEEQEKRGFVHVNLLAIGITATAVMLAIVAIVAITAMGFLQSLIAGAPAIVILAGKLAAYLLLLLAGAGAAATLYQYGPSRSTARWIWLTPGSVFAALMWLVLTIGFGIYVAQFGNYNATYGSLGAVVVTMTWLYLSSYILIFGAELNSELERQSDDGGAVGVVEAVPGNAAIAAPSRTADAAVDPALGRRIAPLVAVARLGWTTSIAATVGLTLLKRGRAAPGAAVLLAAAGATWIGRERPSSNTGGGNRDGAAT